MGLETTSIKKDRLSGIPQLSLIASYLRELCNRELIPTGYGQISKVILPPDNPTIQSTYNCILVLFALSDGEEL